MKLTRTEATAQRRALRTRYKGHDQMGWHIFTPDGWTVFLVMDLPQITELFNTFHGLSLSETMGNGAYFTKAGA